jgi:uncharacterized membrane protein YfcA
VSVAQLALISLAGLAAGAVNALAGGGTLISFPLLLAVGLPPIAANVTNTIALCPGYLGAAFAQRGDLRGQGRRAYALLPIAILGGYSGALLLLRTGERAFGRAVPWLILGACVLLSAQARLRAWLAAREALAASGRSGASSEVGRAGVLTPLALPLVGAAAVYGGYFGAGMSVIVLAALGLTFTDTLPRLNAIKQALALATNCAAALLFAASGPVNWHVVPVLAAGALVGGTWGGTLSRRMSPRLLRYVVVLLGMIVATLYWLRMI